jgi:hypothetical protein
MAFAGGRAQADYMARVRGIPPEKCLVVPIDVGKHSAVSLVADHEGRVVHDPITFPMTATGTRTLVSAAGAAERATTAGSVRFGIEAAGHYHRVLASTLHASGLDVVELNPAAVKLARSHGRARTCRSPSCCSGSTRCCGLDHLLPARRVQQSLPTPACLHVAQAHRLAPSQTPQGHMEAAPPPLLP